MVDHLFYQNIYRGDTLSPEEWETFAPRAQVKLEQLQRIYTVTPPDDQAIGMAVCAMAEALAFFDSARNGGGGAVSSASIGSVSVRYDVTQGPDISEKGIQRELLRRARVYLDIYRGVC